MGIRKEKGMVEWGGGEAFREGEEEGKEEAER